ncbi:hypothetical protein EIP91_007222 [Steccherinum ochraceum]|uniref:Cupin 2 conserved barrel domain-containing protein n=1 Tax=Steccherinum ochraceum TaxID=92696 RepID=A0A4V2MVG2_9APHY|nr:hypothetical protein EIP91_007222 [Steccherinum ochraceum]
MSQEEWKSPGVRRIVTGHDPRGLAGVRSDEVLQPRDHSIMSGVRTGTIWATESLPTKDNNLEVDGAGRVLTGDLGFVSTGATHCLVTEIAPGATTLWHRTSSLDHNILISGKLVAILEDGSELVMDRPGDVLIQRGTMHTWHNPGPEWVRYITVIVDAESAVVNGRALKAELRD